MKREEVCYVVDHRFYSEVLVPIEHSHRAGRVADEQAEELAQSLRKSMREATATTRRLEQGTARRRTAEAALKKSEHHRAELLAEAERLQGDLRKMTHRILSAQEAERKETGHRLQDEIGQALLAIHIRLFALKKAGRANAEILKKEIAETQQMVKHSVQAIQRLAHALDDDHDERVEMVGGKLTIESAPDRGTVLRVQGPVDNGGRKS